MDYHHRHHHDRHRRHHHHHHEWNSFGFSDILGGLFFFLSSDSMDSFIILYPKAGFFWVHDSETFQNSMLPVKVEP